ncbi:MAG: hypothetical protein KAY32_15355 [Candidatus Eisenbacteria sp.]|nr:hypothetical protein [Candidatus Eisenbacteria bacterium]
MDVTLFGVRVSTGQETSIKATKEGDLYIAQNLPPYALAAAAGRGWWAQAIAAAAGTVTIPTTTALGTLWNGETGSGKSYIIDRIFANTGAYDAGTNFFFLWLCIHQLNMTAPTADITIHGLRGGDTTYGGSARFDVGATVVNDGWFSVGNSMRNAAGNADGMSNIDYKMDGRIVLPPTSGLSIHVGCNDSNITAQVGVSWYEVQLDLA